MVASWPSATTSPNAGRSSPEASGAPERPWHRLREAGASDVATVEDTRRVIEAAGHLDVKCGGV